MRGALQLTTRGGGTIRPMGVFFWNVRFVATKQPSGKSAVRLHCSYPYILCTLSSQWFSLHSTSHTGAMLPIAVPHIATTYEFSKNTFQAYQTYIVLFSLSKMYGALYCRRNFEHFTWVWQIVLCDVLWLFFLVVFASSVYFFFYRVRMKCICAYKIWTGYICL